MSSSGNLSGYHIPHLAPGTTASGLLDDLRESLRAPPTHNPHNPRLLAPGKQSAAPGGDPAARPSKRKVNGEKTETESKTGVDDSKGLGLALFPGRDKSYPDELNRLIGPLSCELCKAQMTSLKCARDHYESKAHDRHISAWLAKNYTDAGLQAPPVKRLLKQGPSGPAAFHCDLCDLDLTSATHARQHYQGRRHKLVEQKGSRPSGAGYYDSAGKWVRTGSKFEPKAMPDARYGIGTLFLKTETGSTGDEAADSAAGKAGGAGIAAEQPARTENEDSERSCSLCKIVVTSANQMQMHLDGARHQSKLRNAGQKEPPDVSSVAPAPASASALATENPDGLDLLLYRTPTGQYYCKPCNKMMNHVTTLQQHLVGKKHLKTAKNSQQANTLA
ncbi:hypothetical protein KR054_012404 [Drosophila jambulina]|nr:hypothetical protein KR054_012404 [Drosophila jambulina]